MKKIFLYSISILLNLSINAQIDISSGGAGIAQPGQSFNETRGTDVKVIEDIKAHSFTLIHFNNSHQDSMIIGLRIYNSTNEALLYRQDKIVGFGFDQSISFNTSFDFLTGQYYRISFYANGLRENQSGGSFTGYKPNFPYTESKNILSVNQAYSTSLDQCPNNINQLTPYFTIKYSQNSAPCKACNCSLIYALLVLIILLLLYMIRKCCK